MLQEASNIRAIADFPWLLSPAAAIVAVVLGVNLVTGAGGGALGLVSRLERRAPAHPERSAGDSYRRVSALERRSSSRVF